jgi:hypothetical protein
MAKVEGCKGATLNGAVFFRMAINAVLTTIKNTRTTAHAAMVLPAFGLPAIITSNEMPIDPARERKTEAPRLLGALLWNGLIPRPRGLKKSYTAFRSVSTLSEPRFTADSPEQVLQ